MTTDVSEHRALSHDDGYTIIMLSRFKPQPVNEYIDKRVGLSFVGLSATSYMNVARATDVRLKRARTTTLFSPVSSFGTRHTHTHTHINRSHYISARCHGTTKALHMSTTRRSSSIYGVRPIRCIPLDKWSIPKLLLLILFCLSIFIRNV